MLYQVGPVTVDTFPFSADEMSRSGLADLPAKPVMGTRPPREFMGPGEDKVTLSGQLLPSKIGGLTELAALQSLRDAGTQVPVMRGDGTMLGWYAISGISERHTDLLRDGVGFRVRYTLDLVRVGGEPSRSSGSGIVGMLLSLFEGL